MSLKTILQQSLDNFNVLTENNTVYVDVDLLDQGVADTVMELLQEDPERGTILDTLLDTFCPPSSIVSDDGSFQNGIHTWLLEAIKLVSEPSK